uniref:Uncharacterized protein n=1 Tax=Trypanosoma congolense (strain IL3000) TaxID=1068625 RepID=G0UUV4_TRYCI|nr:hypothetical protein, unlikely [Trypanosoma congolense IL3000]
MTRMHENPATKRSKEVDISTTQAPPLRWHHSSQTLTSRPPPINSTDGLCHSGSSRNTTATHRPVQLVTGVVKINIPTRTNTTISNGEREGKKEYRRRKVT